MRTIRKVFQFTPSVAGRRWVYNEERKSCMGLRNRASGRCAPWETFVPCPSNPISPNSHRRTSLEIPLNEYYEYFGPEYELDVRASNMDDLNTPQYLERVKRITLENLRHTGGPPSVQVQREFLH